ncbi:MAG: 3-keto-5-aminohexanoate cleavage protein [Xanthobacteraceae bacterium]
MTKYNIDTSETMRPSCESACNVKSHRTTGGGGGAGRNPFDFMEYVRRSPHGSVPSIESLWRTVAPFCAMGTALGIHVRVGIEDNLWRRKGVRMTSVEQIEQVVQMAKLLERKVATGDEARQILKIGVWYDSVGVTVTGVTVTVHLLSVFRLLGVTVTVLLLSVFRLLPADLRAMSP